MTRRAPPPFVFRLLTSAFCLWARRTWRALCCEFGFHRYGYCWLFDARASSRHRGLKCDDCGKVIRLNFNDRP